MRKFAAYRIIALALLMAVSQIALASHEAAHSGADVVQCELCFSHAQVPVGSIQSHDLAEFGFDHGNYHITHQNYPIAQASIRPYQARAPPLFV